MKRLLQHIEPAVNRQSFNGTHLAPGALTSGRQTGTDLLAIEQHSAGAAVAGITAYLGASQTEFVTQGIRQTLRRSATAD
jgi:hypothetical protein